MIFMKVLFRRSKSDELVEQAAQCRLARYVFDRDMAEYIRDRGAARLEANEARLSESARIAAMPHK